MGISGARCAALRDFSVHAAVTPSDLLVLDVLLCLPACRCEFTFDFFVFGCHSGQHLPERVGLGLQQLIPRSGDRQLILQLLQLRLEVLVLLKQSFVFSA